MTRFLICLFLAVSSLCGPVGAQSKMFEQGRQVGRIRSKILDEISGIVASRKNPGVFWVHNDSGDRAQIYAIDVRGRLLSTFLVTGAKHRDWEDIAIGPGPVRDEWYLYIGDIGDNKPQHETITVYRVPEPTVSLTDPIAVSRTAKAEAIVMKYPEGDRRDAETLIVDPLNGDLYIISKREMSNGLYYLASPRATDDPVTLEFKARLPVGFSVGGDISPNGRFVAVRSAFGAVMFERVSGKPLWEAFKRKARSLPVKSEKQGEAIAFDLEGQGYYTVSEGKNQPIYYYERIKAGD